MLAGNAFSVSAIGVIFIFSYSFHSLVSSAAVALAALALARLAAFSSLAAADQNCT
jgi:hypothetical protein